MSRRGIAGIFLPRLAGDSRGLCPKDRNQVRLPAQGEVNWKASQLKPVRRLLFDSALPVTRSLNGKYFFSSHTEKVCPESTITSVYQNMPTCGNISALPEKAVTVTRSGASIPITELLRLSQAGDAQAEEHLFRAVFGQLRRIAAASLREEHNSPLMEPTELVNEAYLHLFGERNKDFKNRDHFFRVAARAMRCILIDIARKRRSAKRSVGLRQVELDVAIPDKRFQWPEKVLMFESVLVKLEQFDRRAAEIVELKVFLGLTDEQVAENLGCSSRTVKRDYKVAKSWLRAELGEQQSNRPCNAKKNAS